MTRSSNRAGTSGKSRESRVSDSDRERRALVKWLEGTDAGSYAHDIELDCIVELDSASPVFPETYAIEWRVGHKPRAGWPIYEAYVIDISSDQDFLKSKAQQLELDNADRSATDSRTGGSNTPTLMDINSDAFRTLILTLTNHRNAEDSTRSNRSSSSPTPATSQSKVLVGKSLYVTPDSHMLAMTASSPGRMIRPLLRQAFSRSRLGRSTYAGQTRRKDNGVVAKPGLKKYQKMADIHACVLKRFPHLSQASFGAAVNSFLGEGPNAIHHMEYVEESQSEEEM